MLQNGADVNFRFASLNSTALMTAAFHGNVGILRMLLSAGANVKAYDLQQSTALGYAFGGIFIHQQSHSNRVILTLYWYNIKGLQTSDYSALPITIDKMGEESSSLLN
jgi:hypothetical protein